MRSFRLTTRRLMIVVACLAILMWFLGWFFDTRTYYAPGYTETKFRTLRIGMTRAEVEAMVGPPLTKVRWSDGSMNWVYSDRPWDTLDFERRWVIFKDDKVTEIVNDKWEE
jgi:hypothetical protein